MADLIFRRCLCMSFVKKTFWRERIFSRAVSHGTYMVRIRPKLRFESMASLAGRSSTSAHCSRVDSEA